MNKKHMNAQLCRVFDKFVNSIEDEEVRDLVNRGSIITGGALVSLLTGEEPHDWDLYFKGFNTCYKVAEYFVNKWNNSRKDKIAAKLRIHKDLSDDSLINSWITMDEALAEYHRGYEPRIKVFIRSNGVAGDLNEEEDYDTTDNEMQTNVDPETNIEKTLEETPVFEPKFLTSNAISLTGKMQLVIRFYGNPSKLHENYDFVHCTNYWTSWERQVVLKQEALESIINKELKYVGSKYPLCSIIRTRKFIGRGWTINAGQYLKMAMQLNKLDLTSIGVLEDQLVGVDSLYFQMLISALQKKKEENPEFEINDMYITTIIDKLF